MASEQCLENIRKQNGTYCGDAYCRVVQEDIQKYCHHTGLPPNTPVPMVKDGRVCYCCCGGVAEEALVQTSESEQAAVQDIKVGDKVMGTGLDAAEWALQTVTSASGVAPGQRLTFMHALHVAFDDAHDTRRLMVTADHLFVTNEDGRRVLVSAEALGPGDTIVRADGGTATVISNTRREHACGLRLIALGDYEGGSLDGHLTNLNGLLSADFSVQSWFYSGGLAPHLIQSR